MFALKAWPAFLAGLVLLNASECMAANAAQQIAEQIVAGEFAPALAAVANLSDIAEREAWLVRIAEAQADAGARDAAYSTVAQMGDALKRRQALDAVASQARGGGVEPDFDSLIELLTATIAPTTWMEVGGAGAVKPFAGGVYVDPLGALRRAEPATELSGFERRARASGAEAAAGVHRASLLRQVSLPRLEREIQVRLAAGKPLDEEMWLMAGLRRVEYVLVYPETGDVVVAGPAGGWEWDAEGRPVDPESRAPILRLEDLVTLIRLATQNADMRYGCSITPTQQGLANTRLFVEQSNARPLRPGQRTAWLADLRATLGEQDIEVYGIPAQSRAARVLVEADYRMKLIGAGLEEGTLGVTSYLASLGPNDSPALDVLRWWFTMNYDALRAAPDRRTFAIRGPGVKVLSENELLAATGQRVHTGQSDEKNQEFAANFTQHFAALAEKYPIYAELRNVFDLSLVAAILRQEDLPQQVGWHLTAFTDAREFALPAGRAPERVMSIVHHRQLTRERFVAVASGGVSARPADVVKPEAMQMDRDGELATIHAKVAPRAESRGPWWWD